MMLHRRLLPLLLTILMVTLLAAGCAPRAVIAPPLATIAAMPTSLAPDPAPAVDAPRATPTLAAAPPLPATPASASSPTASATAVAQSPRPVVPPHTLIALDGTQALSATLPLADGFGLAATDGTAAVTLRVAAGEASIGHWVLAAVAPLYTPLDATTTAELQQRWRAETPALAVSPATLALLTPLWGAAGPGIQIVPATALGDRLWQADDVWGIVPFEVLTLQFKVLTVDGQNPLRHAFDVASYALALPIAADGAPEAVAALRAAWGGSNRDGGKLTRVALTGVTAFVRATAYAMETNGILWPGEEVAPVLQAADIAHISNEVSFVPDCPFPNPIGGTSFCSDARYMALLESLGTDVIELTGNHLSDYGAQYLSSTIDLYSAAGMATYGGGRNADEAATPYIRPHNGNSIAFVGCNSFGPSFAWATADTPGARMCDAAIFDQIGALRAAGHIVIVTLQYTEDYVYAPWPQQISDFRAYVDAGAHIVSGSQGHHVQGFDLYRDGVIHYGPGNLFFDQMFTDGTRQALIDEYVIYDGQPIGLEITTALIEDYARPRIMTEAERAATLATVFGVSLPPSR